ncbi:FAD-dependent isoamyl alcohol oxidase (FAD binding domain protein) [Seiridium cupressi]
MIGPGVWPTPSAMANAVLLSLLARVAVASTCKNIPGDPGWPSQSDWAKLNATVGGRLIQTVPQASVCHHESNMQYDAAACAELQNDWTLSQTHPSKPCELGNYATYSINVTEAADIIAGLDFTNEHNIRLVIKNTGHDYLGKSTGVGALSLWTWNLKTTELIKNYTSSLYSGPAMKVGSGVVGGEAIEIAAAEGYRIVGGECGSVAPAGGYATGGGHSVLNTAYGMAADNVLEWEVVTATGQYLIATPYNNTDLYWALSGGGGGTYAVVLSMTAKAHTDSPVLRGRLVFNDPGTDDGAAFWEAVTLWMEYLPSFIINQNTILFEVLNNTFDGFDINLIGETDPAVLTELLSPYLGELDRLKITYQLTSNAWDTYRDFYDGTEGFGPLPYGSDPATTTLNSRLIPTTVLQDREANAKFIDSLKLTVETGDFLVGCVAINVTNHDHVDNAVLPAWRDAAMICNFNAFWNFTAPIEQNLALKRQMNQVYTPAIEEATPGSGVYLNEMDPLYIGDWKQTMYGVNYGRLEKIKDKYDPNHTFYGLFAVGSDYYASDGSGRLCHA